MRFVSNNNAWHIISSHPVHNNDCLPNPICCTVYYQYTHLIIQGHLIYIGILASNSSSYSVLLCHFLSSQIVLSLRTTAPEMQTSQQEEEEWQGGTTFGTDVAKSQSNKLSH